jgi:hypothetical protein
MIFDAKLQIKGKNIFRWTFLGSQTQNIAQISAEISKFPVIYGNDEYLLQDDVP